MRSIYTLPLTLLLLIVSSCKESQETTEAETLSEEKLSVPKCPITIP